MCLFIRYLQIFTFPIPFFIPFITTKRHGAAALPHSHPGEGFTKLTASLKHAATTALRNWTYGTFLRHENTGRPPLFKGNQWLATLA